MNIMEAMEKRRSIRKFKETKIPEEVLKKVLNTGRLAPSGGNMQPWEFIIVKETENIDNIVQTTFIGFNKHSSQHQTWLKKAPVLVIVCADFLRTTARYGEIGKRIALMDVAAAIENILLAAASMGLGGCWVSGFDQEELSKLLSIPEAVKPVGIIPLGYPESIPQQPYKFELEEIIHYEKYGNLKF